MRLLKNVINHILSIPLFQIFLKKKLQMFLKKYRVKSSTTIKGSERKKLRSAIEQHYPTLSSEDINQVLSAKSDVSQTKVLVHNGDTVTIYFNGNTPAFFSVEDKIFPSLYTLWKFPKLVPAFITVPLVLNKICNGADLMAPGVIVNDATKEEFQNLKVNDVCSVCLEGNRAPIAVGIALQPRDEMLMDTRKGKAVQIYHFYKDNLWAAGDQCLLPLIPETASNDERATDDQDQINENTIQLSSCDTSGVENSMSTVQLSASEEEDDEESNNFSMDDILKQSFMLSLKVHGKKITLPVLSSTFYRTYVLNCIPTSLNFDIKKTTYKKLSVFLKSMSSDGLLEVKELSKGVEKIVSINVEHELIKTFVPHPLFREHLKQQKQESITVEPQVQDNYKFPEIIEMFVVSAQVQRLFQEANYRKGDALTASKVRDVLREYVMTNSLQDEKNPRMVNLDPVLSNCLLRGTDVNRSCLTWEELFEKTSSSMSPAFTISFDGGEPKLKKGHVDPIDIKIATRTGNKKVTLIHNLENFGINQQKFANHMQVAVAASTSIGTSADGKGSQVLIQGNQLRYLNTLFCDIYKVPKKYLRGLENVSTKKKK